MKRKIRRPRPSSFDNLEMQVASIFQEEPTHIYDNSKRPTKKIVRQPQMNSLLRLDDLFERLTCISRAEGKIALSELRDNLTKRKLAASHVSAQFLVNDEIESYPHLCVIVALLKDGIVTTQDLDADILLERATFEQTNQGICTCRNNQYGLKGFIQYIVRRADDKNSQNILEKLVSILFLHKKSFSSRSYQITGHYALAEYVLRYLSTEFTDHELNETIFETWVRRAIVPLYTEDDQQNGHTSIHWTSELSSLATGRPYHEHMKDGKREEETVLALLRIVTSNIRIDTYLECIDTLLNTDHEKRSTSSTWKGSWTRVALLGSHLTNESNEANIDSNFRDRAQSALSGAICTKIVLSDPDRIPIIISLCRRLLVSNWNDNSEEKGHTDFQKWLLDTSKQGREVITALLESLSQIVHLESLRMLRISYRVFTSNFELRRIATTYLDLVKIRIDEVNPTYLHPLTGSKPNISEQNGKNGSAPASETFAKVAEFVSHFAETKGKVSQKLIKEMNFRRYYFSKTTLPVLLQPALIDHIHEHLKKHTILNKDNFDKHRLDLIRELAFKRKDCGIKAAHAKNSIKAIEEFLRNKRLQKNNSNIQKSPNEKPAANVTTESSLVDILTNVVRSHGRESSNELQKRNDTHRKENMPSILVQKLRKLTNQTKTEESRTKLGIDLVQTFISVVLSSDAMNLRQLKLHNSENEKTVQDYVTYWTEVGVYLTIAMEEVVSDKVLAFLSNRVDHHVYALVCLQTEDFGQDLAFSLAVLATILQKLYLKRKHSNSSNAISKTTSYPSPVITSLIFDSLPSSEPHQVRFSTTFTAHYLLFLVLTEDITSTQALTLNGYTPEPQLTNQLTRFTKKSRYLIPLFSRLQWIASNPWRLVESQYGQTLYADKDGIPIASVMVMIRFTCGAVANRSTFRIDPLSIQDYIEYEKRCGWCRPEQIRKTFNRYKENGLGTLKILETSIASIVSTSVSDLRQATSILILQGLALFLSDTRFETKCYSNGTSDELTALTITSSHAKELKVEAIALTIDVLQNAEYPYFHGFSINEALVHAENLLVPVKWPFTTSLAHYIFRRLCYDTSSSGYEDLDKYFMTIASIVSQQNSSQYNLRKDQKGNVLTAFNSQVTTELPDIIEELVRVMEFLTDYAHQVDSVSQECTSTTRFSQKTIRRFPQTVGVGIVLHIFRKSFEQAHQMKEIFLHAFDKIARLVPNDTMEKILSTSITSLVILPFARESSSIYSMKQTVCLITDMMQRFPNVSMKGMYPIWLTQKESSLISSADPSLQVLLHWIGDTNSDHINLEHLTESLPFNIYVARLISLLISNSKSQHDFFSYMLPSHQAAQTSIHNLLKIYFALRRKGHRKELLSRICMSSLKTQKKEVSKELLNSIINVFHHVRDREDISFSSFLYAALSSCNEDKHELETILLARGLLTDV